MSTGHTFSCPRPRRTAMLSLSATAMTVPVKSAQADNVVEPYGDGGGSARSCQNDQTCVVILRRVHPRRDRPRCHRISWVWPQQLLSVGLVNVQPAVVVVRIEDHRHP